MSANKISYFEIYCRNNTNPGELDRTSVYTELIQSLKDVKRDVRSQLGLLEVDNVF